MADQPNFRVVWGELAQKSIRRMINLAKRPIKVRIGKILNDLNSRLASDPQSVGEAYLISGNVIQALAVMNFLSIDFAIDTDRFVVLVRTCRALSGHGIDDGQ